jgi:hypothetical protein
MRINAMVMIGAVAVCSFSLLADDNHNNGNNNSSSFESSVIGSVPGLGIGGITSGGAPWVSSGEASISSGGRIHVEVQGLLIAAGGPANFVGTTGPVTMVAAALVCGGTGGTPVSVPDAAVTPSPLNSMGDAEIAQDITLPPACFGPVVLVRIFNPNAALGSQLGPFIAATGLTPNAAQNPNQNQDQNQNGREDNDGGGGHGH